MKKVSLLLCAVLVCLPLAAQNPPAAKPASRTILRVGRLLDVKTGQLLPNQAIVIEGDQIVSVGPAADLKTPAGTTVVDLSKATVLPGMMDMHTHLTGDPSLLGYAGLGISVPREALIGAKNAKITLEAGFTTVRNAGASGFSDVALRDSIEAGETIGPRVIASGPPLGITGGHCDIGFLAQEFNAVADGVADGIDAVQKKVRNNIKYGAGVIKVCATGGVLSLGDDPQHSQYTVEEMKAIVADAHRLGRKVMAHAHGAEGMVWASEAGADSIEHGSYIDDAAIAAMKKNGTYLVPTLYLGDWLIENAQAIGLPAPLLAKAKVVLPEARKNIARAFASGVKVAFGTDSTVYPHGQNAREFAVMVKMGMTPLQAIQTATINAADLAGWSEQAGTIEAGKWADIIAVEGDPTKDVTTLENVKFVMKAGKVYKNTF